MSDAKDQTRQAGGKIEVTKEMVAAGVEEMLERHYGADLADLVESIYLAMEIARRSA